MLSDAFAYKTQMYIYIFQIERRLLEHLGLDKQSDSSSCEDDEECAPLTWGVVQERLNNESEAVSIMCDGDQKEIQLSESVTTIPR